jgi:hypothetical protein
MKDSLDNALRLLLWREFYACHRQGKKVYAVSCPGSTGMWHGAARLAMLVVKNHRTRDWS